MCAIFIQVSLQVCTFCVSRQNLSTVYTSMKHSNIFTSRLNVTTGKTEWIMMDEDYDYCQQIARSAYADMLHDTERNQKYYAALKKAICEVHQQGKEAHVLDIGTGTGLLSMMAASCGADSVVACDAFEPMAACAVKIVDLNGWSHKIKVVPKRSTEMSVGVGQDMPHKANILVTEVFDTELIGEGAIETFSHANNKLLEENSVIIPSSATIYAQLFESEVINNWYTINDIFFDSPAYSYNECAIKIPPRIKSCPGPASVHDIQLSQLPHSSFKVLSRPVPVLRFDWGSRSIPKYKTCFKKVTLTDSGKAHGVFMWWDLVMDNHGDIILSCAPSWEQNLNSCQDIPWRDHWMQAIYHFQEPVLVKDKDTVNLISAHDQFSLWFGLKNDLGIRSNEIAPPICNCSIHLASKSRIGMINDRNRWSKFKPVLNKLVKLDTVCLCLSECSMLGLYAASLGAKIVYTIKSNNLYDSAFMEIAEHNGLRHKIRWILDSKDLEKELAKSANTISLVIGEPYFASSILPWHNLRMWYLIEEFSPFIPEHATIVPKKGVLYLMPVQFDHLWKIRAPVKQAEGFDLTPFDQIIQKSMEVCDDLIDAQPLWEYPCKVLAKPKHCLTFDFTKKISDHKMQQSDTFKFETNGICNGIVLWMDWILNEEEEDSVISTGPLETVQIGEYVKWDMYTKQGVYFIHSGINITPSHQLKYSNQFLTTSADFKYNFVFSSSDKEEDVILELNEGVDEVFKY